MADDFGRVNPVSPHYLDRGAREEPYQGRHSKKQHAPGQESPESDMSFDADEGASEPVPGNHIDLRI